MLAALLILLIGGYWAASGKGKPASGITPDKAAVSADQHDLRALWEWTDGLYKGGAARAEWSIRWDAAGNEATVERLLEALKPELEEAPQNLIYIDQVRSAIKELPSYGGILTADALPSGKERRLVVLFRTTSGSGANRDKLLELIERMEDALRQLEADYRIGMTSRGLTEYNSASEKLAQRAGASKVDRYDDGGTVSTTYYTEKLYVSVEAGKGKKANLQAAVHRDSETGQLRLIAGVPLITGDYAQPAGD
ncbi:YwmB family TATA-box binding protein [Paenibacillus sp. NPDC058071]|uniref:YwmB family TATA-box binding protein n=1 Tax=Paenibacillus sp. NPDC058071 TaxID=3346326 RepID=UPI0036D799A5